MERVAFAMWLDDAERAAPNVAKWLAAKAAALSAIQSRDAGLREDTVLLDALRDQSWDLRCFPVPTGGDDADIGWRVVGHWMAEPRERVVGEVYHDEPRDAIRAALQMGGEKP